MQKHVFREWPNMTNAASAPVNDSRGNALLEFVIVLPLLFIILYGTLELTTMLRGYQLMQSVVKEAGREAFRECSQLGTDVCPGGIPAADTCLLGVRTQHMAFANAGRTSFASIFTNIDLALSSYRLQDVAGVPTVIRVGVAESPTCAAQATCSKYSEASVRASPELNALMTAKRSLTIAEFYGTYDSLIQPFFPADWAGGQYYVRVLF